MLLSQKFLRRLRLAGIVLFFGNTFLFFVYSLFIAFDLFVIFQLNFLRIPLFRVLIGVMVGGFALIFLGSRLQKMQEKDRSSMSDDKPSLVDMTEEQSKFLTAQQEYADPKGPEGRGTWKLMSVTLVLIVLVFTFGILSIEPLWHGFYAYSVAFGAISVACLTALVSGGVSEDVWRLYVRGYHVHESVIGTYFALIGSPLVVASAVSAEFYFGLAYIVAGVFLVGRDWRDVVKGQILVHKSKEPDYEQYRQLKLKRSEI